MMRLHIGASRVQLAVPEFSVLRTDNWIHLGAPEPLNETNTGGATVPVNDPYRSFYYKKGDVLPFGDHEFEFVFSEHFFEHLFLDEAGELLKDCFRVMQIHSCLRIAVPDADQRTYLDPEPAGYTTGDTRWFHPDKHKSRWSIYSLSYVLEEIGFVTQGVVYCDKYGNYIINSPDLMHPFYHKCLDPVIVQNTTYISRFSNSLIVDAIRPK